MSTTNIGKSPITAHRIEVVYKLVPTKPEDHSARRFKRVTQAIVDGDVVHEYIFNRCDLDDLYMEDVEDAAVEVLRKIRDNLPIPSPGHPGHREYIDNLADTTELLDRLTLQAWQHRGIPATNQPPENPAQLHLPFPKGPHDY